MSRYDIQDFVNEANKQIEFYEQQQNRMKELLDDYETKIKDLSARTKETLRDITKILVPAFTESNLRTLAQRINNPALNNLIANKEKERKSLEEIIQTIEATPEFLQKDIFQLESLSEKNQELAQIELLRPEAERTIRLFESVPRHKGLLERGYGTSSYPHTGISRFFKSEFLQDWKYADILCTFFKVSDFTDVLYKYREAKNLLSLLDESAKEENSKKEKIAEITEQYETAKNRLNNIDTQYENHLNNTIELFFTSNPKSVISSRFPDNKEIMNLYASLDGLKHQTEYVKELYKKVSDEISVVSEKIRSLIIETERYRENGYKYRNKRWDENQFSKRFMRDEQVYTRRLDRYRRTGETIYIFNDYGRASSLDNFLWWDIMTDGRLDGNFISEVHDFHSSNPSYTYERDYSSSEYSDES